MASKLNEGSEFTIPLKNLLALIAFTAVSVWAYFGIIERLAFLEHNYEMMFEEVEENDAWIDDFEPPQSVQENIERVRDLELRLTKIETKLSIMTGR
jgi:agmatine/peptidylarginine deiminase